MVMVMESYSRSSSSSSLSLSSNSHPEAPASRDGCESGGTNSSGAGSSRQQKRV